jgi:hypothetical protein
MALRGLAVGKSLDVNEAVKAPPTDTDDFRPAAL